MRIAVEFFFAPQCKSATVIDELANELFHERIGNLIHDLFVEHTFCGAASPRGFDTRFNDLRMPTGSTATVQTLEGDRGEITACSGCAYQ